MSFLKKLAIVILIFIIGSLIIGIISMFQGILSGVNAIYIYYFLSVLDVISLIRKIIFYLRCSEYTIAIITSKEIVYRVKNSYTRYTLCYKDCYANNNVIETKHLFLKKIGDKIPIKYDPKNPKINTINKPFDYGVRLLLLLLFGVVIYLMSRKV